jgi:hypothetical protein
MQPYKGFTSSRAVRCRFILLARTGNVGGGVLVPGRSSSIVEITRFQPQRFTVSIKELAEWFGLEVARLVVDECLAPPGTYRNSAFAPTNLRKVRNNLPLAFGKSRSKILPPNIRDQEGFFELPLPALGGCVLSERPNPSHKEGSRMIR